MKEDAMQLKTELANEQAEVARLKKEMEDMKSRHETELSRSSEIIQAEVASVKKELEEKREAEKKLSSELGKYVTLVKGNEILCQAEKKKVDILSRQAKLWRVAVERLDRAMEAAFPESQDMAVNAVVAARKESVGAREPMWDMDDHLVAMSARVSHMEVLGAELPDAAIQVFRTLWPDTEPPKHVKTLCKWLRDCDLRLNEWRESAARAGADMALSFTLSWYEGIDLDVLTTLRAGSEMLVNPVMIKRRQERAYIMAQYAPSEKFIPEPHQGEDEEQEGDGVEEEGDAGDGDNDVSAEVDEEIAADPVLSPKGPRSSEPTSEEPGSRGPASDKPTSSAGNA